MAGLFFVLISEKTVSVSFQKNILRDNFIMFFFSQKKKKQRSWQVRIPHPYKLKYLKFRNYSHSNTNKIRLQINFDEYIVEKYTEN
ncbi:hypothetical protein FUAX_19850 [Fulvitalea axinellae]|uniref:Uncharacterized protein n=1 Tax=Fulvitalea axinellae TaxID=1182444 RepID=A0AAU9CHN5_9BACT|nr:hypothetical protein FUAX_19850 [Fulvitalea axinellae]